MLTPAGDLGAAVPAQAERPEVEIFDPPMCCPTGLCGPTLDQTLLDVDQLVLALQDEGHRVERYQMMSHPQAFLGHADVMKLVRERQMDALPVTLVHGRIVKVGEYASEAELRVALDSGGDG